MDRRFTVIPELQSRAFKVCRAKQALSGITKETPETVRAWLATVSGPIEGYFSMKELANIFNEYKLTGIVTYNWCVNTYRELSHIFLAYSESTQEFLDSFDTRILNLANIPKSSANTAELEAECNILVNILDGYIYDCMLRVENGGHM